MSRNNLSLAASPSKGCGSDDSTGAGAGTKGSYHRRSPIKGPGSRQGERRALCQRPGGQIDEPASSAHAGPAASAATTTIDALIPSRRKRQPAAARSPRLSHPLPNNRIRSRSTPRRRAPGGATAAALIIIHLWDGAAVNIDLGGGWGGSAYDHLKSNDAVALTGIVPGGASLGRTLDGKLTFRNIRAEMW